MALRLNSFTLFVMLYFASYCSHVLLEMYASFPVRTQEGREEIEDRMRKDDGIKCWTGKTGVRTLHIAGVAAIIASHNR